VLCVEDWAEIRRLHRAEKMPIKVIARVLGCSKNTVKAALVAEGPPKYSPRPVGSIVDAVEPRIRELLAACPTMPATVIAERIVGSVRLGRCRVGLRSCVRCICRRILRVARSMWLGRSLSMISGFRISRCRWVLVKSALPLSCRY
jgi:transposase